MFERDWQIAQSLAGRVKDCIRNRAGHAADSDLPDSADPKRVERVIGCIDESDVEIRTIGVRGQIVFADQLARFARRRALAPGVPYPIRT